MQHKTGWGMSPCYSLKSFTCPQCGRQLFPCVWLLSPCHAATQRSHTSISKPHINKESKAAVFLYSYHIITFFLFSFFFNLGHPFKVQKLALKKETNAQGHNSPNPCRKSIFVSTPSRWLRTLRGRGCCMCDQHRAHAAPRPPGASLSCSHNN